MICDADSSRYEGAVVPAWPKGVIGSGGGVGVWVGVGCDLQLVAGNFKAAGLCWCPGERERVCL